MAKRGGTWPKKKGLRDQVDFSDQPDLEQVTVAKQRTMFQTQVRKSGATDVSCAGFLTINANWESHN